MAFNDIEKRQIKELAAQVPAETIWSYKGHEYQVLGHTMIKLDPEDLPGVVYAANPIEPGTEKCIHALGSHGLRSLPSYRQAQKHLMLNHLLDYSVH